MLGSQAQHYEEACAEAAAAKIRSDEVEASRHRRSSGVSARASRASFADRMSARHEDEELVVPPAVAIEIMRDSGADPEEDPQDKTAEKGVKKVAELRVEIAPDTPTPSRTSIAASKSAPGLKLAEVDVEMGSAAIEMSATKSAPRLRVADSGPDDAPREVTRGETSTSRGSVTRGDFSGARGDFSMYDAPKSAKLRAKTAQLLSDATYLSSVKCPPSFHLTDAAVCGLLAPTQVAPPTRSISQPLPLRVPLSRHALVHVADVLARRGARHAHGHRQRARAPTPAALSPRHVSHARLSRRDARVVVEL